MKYRTEDEIRDEAKRILGFDEKEMGIEQGTGQITTFNQLGFDGVLYKPDGWYLPENCEDPAIIFEAKSEKEDIYAKRHEEELTRNCEIAKTRYPNVIGILYNGRDVRLFRDGEEIKTSNKLQHKSYYLNLFLDDKIDKQKIYTHTKRINEILHASFGIKDLYHRMIFTACALVAKRYGAMLMKGMSYSMMSNAISETLRETIEDDERKNRKLHILSDVFSEIKMNSNDNQKAIDTFIENVEIISECITSRNWNGEDVMSIFFNEFTRKQNGKPEKGQFFTPDHIVSLICRVMEVNANDVILDPCCGSGAFLVKAMNTMIKEVGGHGTKQAAEIMGNQLYGIEWSRNVYALACANMLIHKDGKTGLEQLDSRSEAASNWIKEKGITKVLANPPYESKYGCREIINNVLSSVSPGTECAIILPDTKLDKDGGKKLLKNHTLEKIIKLPENTFHGVGVTTSVFIFEAGIPHGNKSIFSCYIEEDGLRTVKNKGRHDIYGLWSEIEDYWVDCIKKQIDPKYNTVKWIDPLKQLSYPMPETPFKISDRDFRKSMMNYIMFKEEINIKEFNKELVDQVLYGDNFEVKNEDEAMAEVRDAA